MKIYEFRAFPNPLRARMAAAEKGLIDQIEFVKIDLLAGEHKKPAFLAINAVGKVPVLVLDDGTTIAECTAITEYFDHLDGEPILTGLTPKERAITHMMQRRAEALVLDAASDYFHHATPGLGPDIEPFQIHEWGDKQREQTTKGISYFNSVLQKQPYVAGNHFTMADITLFAGLALADFIKIEIPNECRHLKLWRDRVAERPSASA